MRPGFFVIMADAVAGADQRDASCCYPMVPGYEKAPGRVAGGFPMLSAGATGRLLGERHIAAPAERYSAKAILGAARGTLDAPALSV